MPRRFGIAVATVGAAGLIAAGVLASGALVLPLITAAHHAAPAQPAIAGSPDKVGAGAEGSLPAGRPVPVVPNPGANIPAGPRRDAPPIDRCTSIGVGTGRAMPMCAPPAPQP
jgi:hypothetical protein